MAFLRHGGHWESHRTDGQTDRRTDWRTVPRCLLVWPVAMLWFLTISLICQTPNAAFYYLHWPNTDANSLLSSAHACHACHAWCVGEPATVLGTCLAGQSSRVNSLNWRADKLCTPARVLWTLLVHLWATELHNEPVDEPSQTTDPVKSQKSSGNFRNASKWILFQSCQWSYLMSVVAYQVTFINLLSKSIGLHTN